MKYIKNEEAVSPVLGVILMVAITVIVATIIAVFMFGVGAPEEAPTAKLKFTATENGTNDELKLTHAGGDPIIMEDVEISVTDAVSDDPIITGLNLATFCSAGTVLMPGEICTNATTDLGSSELIRVYVVHVPSGQPIADIPQLVVG